MHLSALAITLLSFTASIYALPQRLQKDAPSTSNSEAVSAPFCPPRTATASEQSEIFNAFIQKFYTQKNVALALNDHLDESYIQHNPYALSGRQRAIDALTPIWPNVKITLVRNASAGGFGWAHYKSEMQGSPFSAVVDVFRFNGTCIMEHWDVSQSVPANAINPLALF